MWDFSCIWRRKNENKEEEFLNDLKKVNDTLGHEMGDIMILNFAKLLRKVVPLRYFVDRFGGDEFIVIALTLVLPLDDKVFTRELWESATECPVVFPDGVGVVPWMVPGGREIAVKTAELMKK